MISKSILAVALLAAAGSASASIATTAGNNNELYVQVYDSVRGLTFDLDLGVTVATLMANVNNANYSLSYDLAADANWQQFSSGMNAASTKFGVLGAGATTNIMFTSANPVTPTPPTAVSMGAMVAGIKNQAGRLNAGTVLANTAANLSKLVADTDTIGTGQWSAGAIGVSTVNNLFGTFTASQAAIAYGSAGNFYWDYWQSGAKVNLFQQQWKLSGNTLSFAVAPTNVPVPGAVWMFATGVLGLLGLRRKHA